MVKKYKLIFLNSLLITGYVFSNDLNPKNYKDVFDVLDRCRALPEESYAEGCEQLLKQFSAGRYPRAALTYQSDASITAKTKMTFAAKILLAVSVSVEIMKAQAAKLR